jgi:predicted nucleic-acid-binding protein
MVIFDTNAILRYILRDNSQMANIVEEELSKNECLIPVEVVAEMVYVLSKVYQIERASIKEAIESVSDIDVHIIEHQGVVLFALEKYTYSKLDFVDCLLIGYSKIMGYDIFTFDKKLKNNL